MTNELEKTFFDTFGIEPKKGCTAYDKFTEEEADLICNDKCAECSYLDDVYPQVSDSILLELICILNNYGKNDTWAVSVENLKDCILMNCIKVIKEKDLKEMPLNNFKHQVRTLFEEGEDEENNIIVINIYAFPTISTGRVEVSIRFSRWF